MKKLKIFILLISLIATSMLFYGCNEIKVESISFNQQKITLVVGTADYEVFANVVESNTKLVATVLPYNAKNRSVTFEVDNSNVIEIKNNKIVAKSTGIAHITATTKDGNFSTSAVIEVVSATTKLSTVQNVRFENGKVVWDAVEHANYYSVILNNGLHSETTLTQFTEFESGINNRIQIIANSVGNAYTSSDESAVYTFKQLLSPEAISNENYKITWNAVVGAVSYELFVDGTKVNTQSILTTNFTLEESLVNDGNSHLITVIANGDNSSTFESKPSNSYTVQVLSAPTTISLSQGVIMFNEVPYASSYNIKIGNNVYSSLSTAFAIPETVNAGEHTLTIQAVGSATNYISSNYSLTALTFLKLETVSNFTVENNTVSWNKVTNAGGYLISINNVIYNLGTVSNFYIGEEFEAGTYEIKVACVGTGTQYVMSNFSQAKTLTKLPAPENLKVLNGKVTYNAVQNATSYVLDINGVKKSVSNSETVNNVISLELELESGNYNIKVQAIGNGNQYLNSSYTQSINTTKLDIPSLPVLENGLVKWKAVKNAFGYKVKLNEVEYEFNSLETDGNMVVLDLSSSEYADETYSIQVQALSSEENINSDFCEIVDFKKFKTPLTVKTHLGNLAFTYNANVQNYIINVNGQNQTLNKEDLMVDNASIPSLHVYDFEFAESAESSLNIKVKAQGTDQYISSDFTLEKNFQVCSKLTSLKVANNILSYQNSNDGNVLIECSGQTTAGSIVKIKETETIMLSHHLPTFMEQTLPGGSYSFYVRAQGNSVNLLSGAKQLITTQILNAPTNFKVESGFLKWNGASSVSGYKLKIYNTSTQALVKEMEIGNVLNVSLAGYTDLATNTNYTISIQSVGNGSSTISSSFIDEGQQVVASILSTPKNLKVVDGEIQWDAVENASVYGMYIDGELSSIKSEKIETLQEGIPYGTHNIKIYAIGDNIKYLSSDISLTLEVVKLETPTNLTIKKNAETKKATLYCDMPAYASALLISQTYNEEESEQTYLKSLYPQGIALDISENEAGNYSFKAQAKGDSTKYISSSETSSISTIVMNCPENVYMNKGVVTWSSVTGVVSYNLYISYYGENNSGLISTEEKLNVESNSYVLNTDFEKGYYQIEVKAVGDESSFISSKKSNAVEVEKLGIPTGISTDAGLIVFNELEGAYEYAIYVDGEECGRTKKETASQIRYELPETVSPGTHQIMVQAIGDDTKYITGEAGATVITGGTSVEIEEATMEVIKLSTVNEFKLENGVLTWLPIEIASGYSLKINQINFEEELEQTTTKSSYVFGEDITVGEKTIKLKSIGQNLADGRRILNSNYTEELVAAKLEQVVNIQASYGTEIENCGIITWNRVTNNNGYIISIDGINEEIITEVDQESYEFVSAKIPSGELKIKIKARGTNSASSQGNYISGDYSQEVTYEKLETPTNFKIEDGKLTWDYNSGYSFVVSVTSNGEESCFVVTEQSAVINTNYDSGTYEIKVKAQGKVAEDGTNLLNSSYTDIISAVKPEMPQNVTVDKYGVVTWNAVAKASSYVVIASYTAPGGTSATTEIKYENLLENVCYLGASGIYTFKVYAVSEQGLYSDASLEMQTVLDGFAVGDGQASNPYEVVSVEDFIRISEYPEAHFKQMGDIDLTGIEINAMFTEKEFVGNYNGQGYSISNLTVKGSATQQELGLFSTIGAQGVVRNLNIKNVKVSISSIAGVGGIAGKNYGSISNCSISGEVYNLTNTDTSSTYSLNIGGIVAYNTTTGIVEGCESAVKVKGIIEGSTTTTRYYVTSGSISGANYGTIKQCASSSYASVYGNVAGGISGLNGGKIEQCVNNASVEGTNILYNGSSASGYAGGITGSNSSNGSAIIFNCYNLSNNIKCVNTNINSTGYYLYASGIAGINNSSNTNEAKIVNCYNYATITAYTVDGITYFNSSICYNGKNGYVDSFYYSTSTLEEAVRGGSNKVTNYEQLTEAEMKQESFVTKLNENISSIVANEQLSSYNLSTESCWKLLSSGVVGFIWEE